MGKTLRRYVLVEIAGAFFAGVALFTFVLFVERVLDLVDLVIGRGVPGVLVARLFASILPAFLEITLPMALLLGVVMAFARMSRDGELAALRAAGIDLRSLVAVPMAAGLVVGLATLFLAVGPRPWGHRTLRSTLVEISETRATAALRPKFFNRDFDGLVVYVDRIAVPAVLMLGYWFLLQLLGGVPALASTGGGVAFWAHVGGFVAGLALIFVFRDPMRVAAHQQHLRLARARRWQ